MKKIRRSSKRMSLVGVRATQTKMTMKIGAQVGKNSLWRFITKEGHLSTAKNNSRSSRAMKTMKNVSTVTMMTRSTMMRKRPMIPTNKTTTVAMRAQTPISKVSFSLNNKGEDVETKLLTIDRDKQAQGQITKILPPTRTRVKSVRATKSQGEQP